jgi:alpha-1,6-mannosyltransferase
VPSCCHVVDTTMFWSATSGGVRRYLQAKHAWLERQPGWRHSIAVPAVASSGEAGLESLPALPLPGSGGYRVPLRRGATARVLDALQPDLIEAGDPYRSAWAAIDVGRQRGIPVLAFCHSNLERLARLHAGPFGDLAAAAARRYLRHLYSACDRVLAPSQFMCRDLRAWGIERVECQPLGVDCGVFHPARASRAWRDDLGLGADDRLLVYVGRFAAEKHLDVLAAAVQRLGAPYTLLAIGAGPVPPQGSRVRVLPFVTGAAQLATALASADAFVHAGDQETFGLSALEALACGTPVVARRAAGMAELVDASVGAAVDSGLAEDYAEAIAALLAEDLPARRRAARERAEHHDWSRVWPSLLGHYRSLLRPAGIPLAGVALPLP